MDEEISDNQSTSGFPAIARAAVRSHKPLVAFTTDALRQGAAMALALDYRDAGYATAQKALRVLQGQSPASIPFENFAKTTLLVSEDHARELGFTLPPALVAEAAKAASANAGADAATAPAPAREAR